MSVKFRGGRYEVDVTWPDGVRHRRRMPDCATAERINNRIVAVVDDIDTVWKDLRMRLGWKTPESPASFSDFAQYYLIHYARLYNRAPEVKASRVRILCRRIGKIPLGALSLRHAADFISWRRGEGAANSTINRDLSVLRHMTRWAADQGLLRSDPLRGLRSLPEPQYEGPRPTDEAIAAVIAELPPQLQPLFVFMRETGCRRGEALGLERWQIDQARSEVIFPARATKGGRSRVVPLTGAALEAIAAMPEDGPLVFFDPSTGKQWYSVRSQWETARRKAKTPWLRIKDLRANYGIRLAESGTPMHYIQAVLGHASVVTTERHYARFRPDTAARAVLRSLETGAGFGRKV